MNVRIGTSFFSLIFLLLISVSACGQGLSFVDSFNLRAENYRGRLNLGTLKKVPYYRTSPLNRPNAKVTHAVIVIHGASRRAERTWERAASAAHLSGVLNRTMIIAPKFQIEDDKPEFDEPYWKGGWRGGDHSRDGTKLSSFSVIDHIFHQLCDASRFPNLESIVVAGHSAGGQFTNRYAAAGEAFVRQGVSLRFVVMNPGTYLYLTKTRIKMDAQLGYAPYTPDAEMYPEYNLYRFGLDDLNTYAGAVGVQGLRETMTSRTVHYFCGQLDNEWDAGFGEDNMKLLQGLNRFDCFLRYQAHVLDYMDPSWANHTQFTSVPGIDHDEDAMMHSAHVVLSMLF